MADIFISYAREDRERAKELAGMLEQRGWSVWWDRLIPAGGSFNRIIEAELTRAKCVIVLWSRHSVESSYVQNEASEAEARRVLVPVLVESVRIPLPFRHLHTTSVEDLDHLLSSIRSLIGRKGEAAAAAPPPAQTPRRRAAWISAIVIAALIVTIALLAKKSDDPPSVPGTATSETSTLANDRIPRDEVLEVRLWQNQVDQSVNVHTSEPERTLQVKSSNLVVKVHCGIGIDCNRVTVLFGNEKRITIAENAAVNTPLVTTISVGEIGSPGGKRLDVLYDGVERVSFDLRSAK